MNYGTIIVICPVTGNRLCRDNRWRGFANFGTGSTCVKEYRYVKSALKAGEKYRIKKAEPCEAIASVIHLHEGDSMDAAGRVFRHYHTGEQA